MQVLQQGHLDRQQRRQNLKLSPKEMNTNTVLRKVIRHDNKSKIVENSIVLL